MIELMHGMEPLQLANFRQQYPHATPEDFSSQIFHPIKQLVKNQLNQEQGQLCVYCERALNSNDGQVEHIKPKKKYPHLAFAYTNYAHCCINNATCGQKKKDGVLPIEPAPDCNNKFILNTDGSIEPLPQLTRQEKHFVKQTRDMLGLQEPNLMREREEWIKSIIELMQQYPSLVSTFLADKPFRYILQRFTA